MRHVITSRPSDQDRRDSSRTDDGPRSECWPLRLGVHGRRTSLRPPEQSPGRGGKHPSCSEAGEAGGAVASSRMDAGPSLARGQGGSQMTFKSCDSESNYSV